jgi:8-oxo-(d)GTP phosphatase
MSSEKVVEAAGGVLWRDDDHGVEVAVIHRPKYNDWTLPKGKLEEGEHPVLGALREIAEETGSTAVPGIRLGESRYTMDGRPKNVTYWAMRAVSGDFQASDEVDRMVWLTMDKAVTLLDYERDRDILSTFADGPVDTWPLLLVRHASAGKREKWPGPDKERPLDEQGRRQASAIADVFASYDVHDLYAADVVRCIDTLKPLAKRIKKPVRTEPLLSDAGFEERPEAAVRWLADVAARQNPVAVASQGGPVPELVERLCELHDQECEPLPRTRKGGYVVVHLQNGKRSPIAAVEAFEPPV